MLARTSREVKLTKAGVALLAGARRTLVEADAAATAAKRVAAGGLGILRIGYRAGFKPKPSDESARTRWMLGTWDTSTAALVPQSVPATCLRVPCVLRGGLLHRIHKGGRRFESVRGLRKAVEIASFSYVFSRRRGRPLRAGMEPFMELSRREGADVAGW